MIVRVFTFACLFCFVFFSTRTVLILKGLKEKSCVRGFPKLNIFISSYYYFFDLFISNMVIIISVVWLIVYAQHGKRILDGAN